MSSSQRTAKSRKKNKPSEKQVLKQAFKELGETKHTQANSKLSGEGYVTTNYTMASSSKHKVNSIEELNRGLEVLEALAKTSAQLTIETDITTILERIAESVAKTFGVKKVNFWDYTPDQKAVYIVAAYGMQDQYIANSLNNPMPLGEAWIGRTMATGQAWATSNVQIDPLLPSNWLPAAKKQNYRGLLCLPLKHGDKVIGGMCLYHQDVHEWTYLEYEAMNIVANQAATALVNARSFDALKAEQSKVSSIINSLNDGLLLLDPAKNVLLMNPEAERLLEVKLSDIENTHFRLTSNISNPKVENIRKIIQSHLKPYEPVETEILTSNPLVLQTTLVPVYDDKAKLLGNLYVLHDMTKEHEIELMKSNFISVASHQLRTPLTGISWAVNALSTERSENLTEHQRTILEHVTKVMKNFADLIDDLLDVSRIDEGRMAYEFSNVELTDVVNETAKTLKPFAMARSMKLTLNKPKKSLPEVCIDSKKMSIAVQNLIDNALKYSAQDTGKVAVTYKTGKEFVQLEVKDNGIGIPKKDQEFVFNKFFRAENAVRVVSNGSGLGLYITKQIIEQHNGELSFTSTENKGSTFTIKLPLRKCESSNDNDEES